MWFLREREGVTKLCGYWEEEISSEICPERKGEWQMFI